MQAADSLYCNYSALFCLVHIMFYDYKGTTHLTWDSSPCCQPVILFPQLRTANPQPLVRLLQNTVADLNSFWTIWLVVPGLD